VDRAKLFDTSKRDMWGAYRSLRLIYRSRNCWSSSLNHVATAVEDDRVGAVAIWLTTPDNRLKSSI